MKSTSSALTPRKIAEFCKSRSRRTSRSEVRLLYSCLVDLLERNEYPPYRGSGLDCRLCLPCSTSMSTAPRPSDALAADLRRCGTRSFECGLAPGSHGEPISTLQGQHAFFEPRRRSSDSTEKARKKPGVRPRAIVELPEPLDTTWNDPRPLVKPFNCMPAVMAKPSTTSTTLW